MSSHNRELSLASAPTAKPSLLSIKHISSLLSACQSCPLSATFTKFTVEKFRVPKLQTSLEVGLVSFKNNDNYCCVHMPSLLISYINIGKDTIPNTYDISISFSCEGIGAFMFS